MQLNSSQPLLLSNRRLRSPTRKTTTKTTWVSFLPHDLILEETLRSFLFYDADADDGMVAVPEGSVPFADANAEAAPVDVATFHNVTSS